MAGERNTKPATSKHKKRKKPRLRYRDHAAGWV